MAPFDLQLTLAPNSCGSSQSLKPAARKSAETLRLKLGDDADALHSYLTNVINSYVKRSQPKSVETKNMFAIFKTHVRRDDGEDACGSAS